MRKGGGKAEEEILRAFRCFYTEPLMEVAVTYFEKDSEKFADIWKVSVPLGEVMLPFAVA